MKRYGLRWLVPAMLMAGSVAAAPASARTQVPAGHGCVRPAGFRIAERDAAAVVYEHLGATPFEPSFDYCVTSTGQRRSVRTDPQGATQSPSTPILAGGFLAFVQGQPQLDHSPPSDSPQLITIRTGKVQTVLTGATVPAGSSYDTGAGTDLVLSASGVVAGIGTFYASSADSENLLFPSAAYVEVDDAVTGSSSTLAMGAPGSLSGPQIFQCAAGCNSGTSLVSWTSDGTAQYAIVPTVSSPASPAARSEGQG